MREEKEKNSAEGSREEVAGRTPSFKAYNDDAERPLGLSTVVWAVIGQQLGKEKKRVQRRRRRRGIPRYPAADAASHVSPSP